MQKEIPFEIGKRNLNAEYHWETLNPSAIKITKPTVICFGGNASMQPKAVNSLCRLAQSLVGMQESQLGGSLSENSVDFLGVAYGAEHIGDRTSHLTTQEHQQICESLFNHLIFNEKGKLFSITQLQKNFSLITLFSHCHGSSEAFNILAHLHFTLEQQKLTRQEIESVISKITHISYAPFGHHTFCPSVHFASTNDNVVSYNEDDYISTFGKSLDGIKIMTSPAGKRMGGHINNENSFYDCVEVYTSHLFEIPGASTRPDDHFIGEFERNDKWEIKGSAFSYLLKEAHKTNLDVMSQMMGYCLARSIAVGLQNTTSKALIQKPTTKQLSEEMKDILSQFSEEELKSIL